MNKPTPGPWIAHHGWAFSGKPLENYPDWYEIVSPFDENLHRFSCYGHFGRANAHLIAAAPDLLAALKLAQDACGQSEFPSNIVNAAIAKAEGESS